jgi:hypothetical protein
MRDFISAEDRVMLEKPFISNDMKAFIIGVMYFVGFLFIASAPN